MRKWSRRWKQNNEKKKNKKYRINNNEIKQQCDDDRSMDDHVKCIDDVGKIPDTIIIIHSYSKTHGTAIFKRKWFVTGITNIFEINPFFLADRKKLIYYSNTANCNTKTKNSENVDETFFRKIKHFHMDRK